MQCLFSTADMESFNAQLRAIFWRPVDLARASETSSSHRMYAQGYNPGSQSKSSWSINGTLNSATSGIWYLIPIVLWRAIRFLRAGYAAHLWRFQVLLKEEIRSELG